VKSTGANTPDIDANEEVVRKDSSVMRVDTPRHTRGWVSIATAAAFLDLSPDRLRKTVERHARKVDGAIESNVDGVVARKFGRLWRVRFSASWTRAEGG
jgi:hypothetical protein